MRTHTKHRKFLLSPRLWVAGCVGAVAALAGCQRADSSLPGTLERERLELVADAAEAIVAMPVKPGQQVAAGDLVLVQDGAVAATQLAAAIAQTAQAQAHLDELRNGSRNTTVQAAVARRDRARTQRDDEDRERRRLLGLVAQNLVSRVSYDRQVTAAATANAALAEAEAALRELQQGTRREQVVGAQRAVEQAQAQQRAVVTTQQRLEVRAPRAAIVDALPYHLGEKPPRGATVAVLLATGAPFVRIHVPEPLRARVQPGTAAAIRVDGVAGDFQGRVRYISSEPEFTPYFSLTETDRSRLAYTAEVSIDSLPAAKLPAGLPATVELAIAPSP